jgi:tetratricopeptide (TPR) repeat protein
MPAFDRDGALKRAEKALRQGRIDAAIAEYLHVTEAEPRDWTSAHALGDLYARAGQIDRALAQYARTADHLAAEGLVADALAQFHKSLKLKPGDDYAATRVRELSRRIGLGASADRESPAPVDVGHAFAGAEGADEDTIGDEEDRSPWFTMAELALADGKLEEGRQAVAEALRFGPSSEEAAVAMAYRLAGSSPDAAYQVIDALVDRALDDGDHGAAAAALQEFVMRVPHHMVALMRLVDVAMEGGLEATMYEAQAQLADAYLDAGRGLEARIIAEDLVAREPWNRANIERFRKALGLLGEPDPDAVIAGRLSGESPFLATDLIDFDRQDEGDDGIEVFDGSTALTTGGSISLTTGGLREDTEDTREDAAQDAAQDAAKDAAEDVKPATSGVAAVVFPPTVSGPRLTGEERAAANYRLGLAFRDLGLLDDAVRALEAVTTSERLRFTAASLLGALHRRRGHSAPAIEWLDRATRWAPPATDIGRAVRYDLGEALEDVGDHDRALAVFTGLESEQVGYRDVSVRIQRLLESKPPRG